MVLRGQLRGRVGRRREFSFVDPLSLAVLLINDPLGDWAARRGGGLDEETECG